MNTETQSNLLLSAREEIQSSPQIFSDINNTVFY